MNKKVGTDDNPADVGTKCTEDGKKIVHLLSLNGLRMKMGLELVGTVVLQGCQSVAHVGGTVIVSTAAVTVRVSLEMVITVAEGCLGLWLEAWSQVDQERTPKENNDEETQQGTLCGNRDTRMLATCRPVEIMRWDRGDDQRAELLECHGGRPKWVGALVDTDMFHKRCGDHETAGNGEHSIRGAVHSTVDAPYGTI